MGQRQAVGRGEGEEGHQGASDCGHVQPGTSGGWPYKPEKTISTDSQFQNEDPPTLKEAFQRRAVPGSVGLKV